MAGKKKVAPVEADFTSGIERFRVFFEAASDGILVADMESKRFIHANPAICRMFGYSRDEMLSFGVMDIHPPDRVAYVVSEFEAQAKGEKVTAKDIPCLRKDGSVFFADINSTPAVVDGVECVVGFFRDITDRKSAEDALRKSEEMNKIVVSLTVDYVFRVKVGEDGTMTLEDATENFGIATGRTLEEARTYDSWLKIMHQDDLMKMLEFVNAVISSKQPGELEVRSYVKSGDTRWVQIFARPMVDGTGRVAEVFGAVKDITARKNAEEGLRRANEKLRAIIESSPLAMFVLNTDGIVSSWNPAAERVFGFSAEDAIGRRLPIVPEEKVPEFDGFRKYVLDGNIMNGVHVKRRTKEGRQIDVRIWCAPMFAVDGRVSEMIAMLDDITEAKRNQEELDDYRKRLELLVAERTAQLEDAQGRLLESERLAILGHFAGGVAHEIRNPLAVIDGNVHLMKKHIPEDNERLSRHMDTIRSHVKRTVNTIESLLDLTRPNNAKLLPVELGMWIAGVCENYPAPSNVNLECGVGGADGLYVLADVVQLDIALKNLLKNAADAMPDGGRVRISADQSANGRWAEISVADSGAGIPADMLPKIFHPLFTTKVAGFGFGLSLTRIVMERHGGTIEARNGERGGAVFTLRLPLCEKEVVRHG